MRRRVFILGLGSAAITTCAALGQQQTRPVIGFVSSLTQAESKHLAAAFHRGLLETGFVDGQSATVESRWAEGRYERLPGIVKDLLARRVNVLASTGGQPTLLALKNATKTIPIVFVTGVDPVQSGVIESFNRPGGNITGVNVVTTGLEGKRFGLLKEFIPASAAVAFLTNPTNPAAAAQVKDVNDAARVAGRQVQIFYASTERELEAAGEAIRHAKPSALMIGADPWLSTRRSELVELGQRTAIPTMYQWREFAEAGGLISYGTNLADGYRQAGVYVGRILKGENPADLPALQPTKFELVINLKTAKLLNVQIPPGVLAIADEVIE